MIANDKLNDNLKMISNLLKHFEVNQELTNEEIQAKKSKKSDIISIFAENVDDSVNESEMNEVLRYYIDNYPLTQEDLKEEPITF